MKQLDGTTRHQPTQSVLVDENNIGAPGCVLQHQAKPFGITQSPINSAVIDPQLFQQQPAVADKYEPTAFFTDYNKAARKALFPSGNRLTLSRKRTMDF